MLLPRSVLVIGFRRTGQAVARVLAGRGVIVRACDARSAVMLGVDPTAFPSVLLTLGAEPLALLEGVELVVPSPGVSRTALLLQEAVRRGIPVWSEIELAQRLLDVPVVAVTGTNGKSTTTTVIGQTLRRAGYRTFVGGNLGTPLVEALEDPPEVAVVEVSSFQLEWVERFRPHVSVLLNITPDHLDRHTSFAEYRDLKARILAAQQADDVAVLNHDDAIVRELAPGIAPDVVWFGRDLPAGAAGVLVQDEAVVLRRPGWAEERYPLGRTRLRGWHNAENIAAAVAAARSAGAPPEAVQAAIDAAEPLPHRLALIADRAGIRWYDDSKATNVGAAVRSIESCPGPLLLLAGGVDKGGDYRPLAAAARERVRRAFVFGAARTRIAEALAAADVPVEIVDTLDAAVRAAARVARPGDAVLLAPACSSFDQFTDYAARGRAFRVAVEALS